MWLRPVQLKLERSLQPGFAQLGLANLDTMLTGQTPELLKKIHHDAVVDEDGNVLRPAYTEKKYANPRGFLDIYNQSISPFIKNLEGQALESRTASREADLGDVQRFGRMATDAFKNANPQQAALMDELNNQAMTELQSGASLDPSLARTAAQSTRAAQAARGLGYGNPDVAQEVLNTGLMGEQMRRSRQNFAERMVGLNQATSADPFMAILGRPSTSLIGMGSNVIGQVSGLEGGQSGLFNPYSAYGADVFNTNYNALASAKIAGANNNAAITSAALGAAGGAAGGGSC